jgi:TetR/AcrR family transcriptional regulator, transcriptional repressor for nem operon
LSDITAATGLTKGAIYGNFENKDELALAVFDYNLSLLMNGSQLAMASVNDPLEKLLAMAAFYRREYKNVAMHGGCPVMNASVEADDNFPALKAKVKGSIRGWKKIIVQLIETGKKQNLIKPKIDAEKFATLFIAMIEGGILLSKALDDQSPLNTALDKLDEIIIRELKQ